VAKPTTPEPEPDPLVLEGRTLPEDTVLPPGPEVPPDPTADHNRDSCSCPSCVRKRMD
jgi:hypothetical protein